MNVSQLITNNLVIQCYITYAHSVEHLACRNQNILWPFTTTVLVHPPGLDNHGGAGLFSIPFLCLFSAGVTDVCRG